MCLDQQMHCHISKLETGMSTHCSAFARAYLQQSKLYNVWQAMSSAHTSAGFAEQPRSISCAAAPCCLVETTLVLHEELQH